MKWVGGSRITLMPMLKNFFSLIVTATVLYFAFKFTDPIRILAQANPALAEQINQKYNDYLKFNENIQAQSSDIGKYLSYIKILNTQEMLEAEKNYNEVVIDENIELKELPPAQAVKTLRLSVIRYENLNQSLYTMLEKLQSTGNTITNSGFSTKNMEAEIKKLTNTIASIEANIATLNYVADQIEQKTIKLEDGVNNASLLIGQVNTEYNSMFTKVKELINNNNAQ